MVKHTQATDDTENDCIKYGTNRNPRDIGRFPNTVSVEPRDGDTWSNTWTQNARDTHKPSNIMAREILH